MQNKAESKGGEEKTIRKIESRKQKKKTNSAKHENRTHKQSACFPSE